MWPCIVTNFFIINPTRYTNFPNLLRHENSTCFGQFLCPSSGVYSLYTRHWYVSFRFEDSFRAGPGWKGVSSWSCSKTVFKHQWHIPVPSVQWLNSWWLAEELPETCRVSCRSKFGKLVYLVGFIIKKLLDTCVGVMFNFRTMLCTLNIATSTHIIKNLSQGFQFLLSLQHVANEAVTPSAVFWDGSEFKSRPVDPCLD